MEKETIEAVDKTILNLCNHINDQIDKKATDGVHEIWISNNTRFPETLNALAALVAASIKTKESLTTTVNISAKEVKGCMQDEIKQTLDEVMGKERKH